MVSSIHMPMNNCLSNSDWIAIIGVMVAIITLIVTLRIAKIIPEKDKLSHRKHIREVVNKLIAEMKSGRNHMCKIIDVDRFDNLYPDNFNNRNRQSYFKAELERTDIHGVLFTNGLLGVRERRDGSFVVTKKDDNTHTVARCCLMPYDWIIDIDEAGDENDTCAIFFCKFKNRKIRHGYYCVQKQDGSLKGKKGFYQRRLPFCSYRYYLLEEDCKPFLHYVDVKGDSDV